VLADDLPVIHRRYSEDLDFRFGAGLRLGKLSNESRQFQQIIGQHLARSKSSIVLLRA